jgi:hypothetical protein
MNEPCRNITPILSEYVDGLLSAPEYEQVEAHLAQCAHCRELADDLRRLVSELGDLPAHRPPDELKQRIQLRARAQGLIAERRPFWLRPAAGWIVAAAACLLLAVLLLPGTGGSPAPDPTAEMSDIYHDLRSAENLYLNAIDRMDQLASLKLDQMPPEMRQTFETNLALINQTLAESRTYVLENAQNPRAWEYLLAAYQKKVEFLSLIIETDLG